MATICPSGRPWCSKNTQQKTYFEILWGGPHEENQNKHGKTPTKKNKLYLETLWGEPQPEKQKMEQPKKYLEKRLVVGVVRRVLPKNLWKTKSKLEALWGGPHGENNKHWKNQKTLEKNVFWGSWLTLPHPQDFCFFLLWFFQCFLCSSDDFLFFPDVVSCFLYGALPEESAKYSLFFPML